MADPAVLQIRWGGRASAQAREGPIAAEVDAPGGGVPTMQLIWIESIPSLNVHPEVGQMRGIMG